MIYTVTFNPAIDYVVRLDRELRVGDVNRASGEDCVLGGKGINVSVCWHSLAVRAWRSALWRVRPAPGWSARPCCAGAENRFRPPCTGNDPHQCQNQGGAGDRAERCRSRHP